VCAAWGLALLSLGYEQLALITLGTLFNMIARSEFETCLRPRITPVAYEIGQRCRIERFADLANHREVNVAEVLLSRNRTRKAAKRAADLAAVVDDEDDWAHHFRAYHLGEKLISLALQSAVFDGKPIFESKEDQESSGKGLKTMQRIGLTEAAETWIRRSNRFQRFYFPCQVDHRGRVYPVPPLMNPQSDHIGRALLEFAAGKPLGERGALLAGDPPRQLLLEEKEGVL
jgi:hypothetical protein